MDSSSDGMGEHKIDATVFLNGTTGMAAVVRDDQGRFVGARYLKIASAWKSREAEGIVVIAQGYTYCAFETDSYTLV